MEESEEFRAQLIKELGNAGARSGESVLNILLANANRGKDMQNLASALLARFPSVRCVLEASYEELMTVKGMTSSAALYLKACDIARGRLRRGIERIESPGELVRFISRRVGEFDYEYVEVYVVDKSGNVLKSFTETDSNLRSIDVDVRGFIGRLKTEKAYGFYMVHNHLTMNANPSENDDRITFHLLGACRARGLELIDHCIVAYAGAWYSYRLKGRLD